MLKRKKLLNWVHKRISVISDNLQAFCTTKDQDHLHKVRVEIKKLRALIYLLRALGGYKYKMEKQRLKEVFQHTGRIRDAHLQLQLIADMNINDPGFTKSEEEYKSREEHLLCMRLDEYVYNLQKVRKVFTRKLTAVDHLEAQSLMKLEWDKVVYFIMASVDVERMHDERKQLKQLMYMLRILPDQISEDLHIEPPFLDELADKIGKWHDLLITVQLLRSRNDPETITMSIEAKAQSQLNEVRSLMQSFRQSHLSEQHWLVSEPYRP